MLKQGLIAIEAIVAATTTQAQAPTPPDMPRSVSRWPGPCRHLRPAIGPVTFRYAATVRDRVWHEEGWMTRPGAAAARVVQLDLKRSGATDWPAAGAVKRRHATIAKVDRYAPT